MSQNKNSETEPTFYNQDEDATRAVDVAIAEEVSSHRPDGGYRLVDGQPKELPERLTGSMNNDKSHDKEAGEDEKVTKAESTVSIGARTEESNSNVRPTAERMKRWGLGLLAGGVALTAVVNLAVAAIKGDKDTDSATRNRLRTPATASPAPTPETITPSTVVNTELDPNTTQGTVHINPNAAKSGASGAASGEASTNGESQKTSESLSSAELEEIIRMSGFEGLRDHSLEVLERSDGIIMVSIDGAEPATNMSEIKAALANAENIAAANPTFTASLKLGPDNVTDVNFQVNSRVYSGRYFFIGDDISGIANTAFTDGFTTANASVIRNQSGDVDGVDRMAFTVAVEAAQNNQSVIVSPETLAVIQSGNLDTSYLQGTGSSPNEALNIIGPELFANSAGFSYACKVSGISKTQCASWAAEIPLRAYTQTGAHYLPELI